MQLAKIETKINKKLLVWNVHSSTFTLKYIIDDLHRNNKLNFKHIHGIQSTLKTPNHTFEAGVLTEEMGNDEMEFLMLIHGTRTWSYQTRRGKYRRKIKNISLQ